MYVCVCMAVTERQIDDAARAGSTTLKDLRRELGVSSECGQCATCARQCLAKALANQCPAAKTLPPGPSVPAESANHQAFKALRKG